MLVYKSWSAQWETRESFLNWLLPRDGALLCFGTITMFSCYLSSIFPSRMSLTSTDFAQERENSSIG